ncbi:MAG: DegV family protein [Syntrophomonadaceae bacterium]|jgi:DegV family protein with EDD domain|nr:DegV family protein [Syntrophomonadaceae bacterium]
MAVTIVTDSTAYLAEDIINEYDIKVVPLNVSINGEAFQEGSRYSNHDYYQRLRSENIFPTTSRPSAGDFYEVFSKIDPGDTIIGVLISTGISGALYSAEVARGMLPEREIILVDSRYTVMALAFQVIRAAEMAREGHEVTAILAEMERIREGTVLHFLVDDLEYLYRGGRLTRVEKLLGNVLQIKPILYMNEGKIMVYEKVRTKNKALDKILADFTLRVKAGRVEAACIQHVEVPEEALELREMVEAIFDGPVLMAEEAGPVIGSHVGPGSLALAYY